MVVFGAVLQDEKLKYNYIQNITVMCLLITYLRVHLLHQQRVATVMH